MSLFGPMPWPISICANCKVWILCNMLFTSEDLESNHNKRKSIYCINNLILNKVQVILFGDWLRNFLQNLHELFCQFISWTNRVDSGKSLDNWWMASYGWYGKIKSKDSNYIWTGRLKIEKLRSMTLLNLMIYQLCIFAFIIWLLRLKILFLFSVIIRNPHRKGIKAHNPNFVMHLSRTRDAQWSLFSSKSQTWAFWADKFWGIRPNYQHPFWCCESLVHVFH